MSFNATNMFGTLVLLLAMPIIAALLAAEKGRNVTLWAILGAIPGFNVLAMFYFVGARNLILEEKLDRILAQIESE